MAGSHGSVDSGGIPQCSTPGMGEGERRARMRDSSSSWGWGSGWDGLISSEGGIAGGVGAGGSRTETGARVGRRMTTCAFWGRFGGGKRDNCDDLC